MAFVISYLEGVSVREPDIKEPASVTVNGKEYDYNDVTQQQRKMERDIRDTKRKIEIWIKESILRNIKKSNTINSVIGTTDNPVCNPNYKKGGLYTTNCGYYSATYEMEKHFMEVEICM